MKKQELQSMFNAYCKVFNLTIDRSRFEGEGESRKYISAKPETVYLGQSDPRAGNTWAIIQNTDNGCISCLYGYVSADRLCGYMEGEIQHH